MKQLFFVLLTLPLFLSAQVKFSHTAWAEAQKQAKLKKRYIFLDAYTDWCGWCKVMDKKTFSDSTVARFMNKEFINLKYEMEKEPDGIRLAMKYAIASFPSFLVFDSSGHVVYRMSGYMAPDAFMKELKAALDKNKQCRSKSVDPAFTPEYPTFYRKSFVRDSSNKMNFPQSTELNAYLSARQDLTDELSWLLCRRFYFMLDAAQLDRVYSHLHVFRDKYCHKEVEDMLISLLSAEADQCMETKEPPCLEEFLQRRSREIKMVPDSYDLELNFRISFYSQVREWHQLYTFVNKYIDKHGYSNGSQINSISWDAYEHCGEEWMLKEACRWMKELAQKEPLYAYLDTYAALLYKVKDYKAAEKYALKAIAAGKKDGETYTETEKLLQQIRAAMPGAEIKK